MSRHEIDVLQMEADNKLPHWLDPRERNKGKFDALRAKHRAKHVARQRAAAVRPGTDTSRGNGGDKK